MTRSARLATGALVVVLAAVVYLISQGGSSYLVHVKLVNADGLRAGFKVRIDGVPVGEVTKVSLGRGDIVTADAQIDPSAAPVGAGARATVRAINLLGEKYLDIDRGNLSRQSPSGVLIPTSHSGVAVELDDVIDSLDLPTRAALNVVLNESGQGLAGHHRDLMAAVMALPPALDHATQLVEQLHADNGTLGRLVDESDRTLAQVAPQHANLGRLVQSAATTLAAVGARERRLSATVGAAPGALSALQRALGALDGAAIPLQPAAIGLRATAPALTDTLRALPNAATAAGPALRAARDAAPILDKLGTIGAPVASDLHPLAGELARFSAGIDPTTTAADASMADILGVMEGWARTTAPRDAAGHVFRLAVGGGADLLSALAKATAPPAARRSSRPAPLTAPAVRTAPAAPTPTAPPPPKIAVPPISLPKLPPLPPALRNLLPYLLQNLQPAGPQPGAAPPLQKLLNYLLGR